MFKVFIIILHMCGLLYTLIPVDQLHYSLYTANKMQTANKDLFL